MNRTTQLLTGATLTWLGILLCANSFDALGVTESNEPAAIPPHINTIREMSELAVLEVEASEIVSTSIRGYTGGTSVIVLVHATVTYSVDLEQARYVQTDSARRHLVIALPEPYARQITVDPLSSQVLRCERSGLWQLALGPAREDEALMSAIAIGQDRLSESASREDHLNRARQHAEAALARFLSETSWTLEIRWEG